MFFLSERIDTILKELKTLILADSYKLCNVKKKDGYYHDIESADASDEPFVPFDAAHLWGGDDTFAWFRASFKVPEAMQGRRLIFALETGNEGWDATNPQFLVFINGVLMQGFDVNHKDTPLCEMCESRGMNIYLICRRTAEKAHIIPP